MIASLPPGGVEGADVTLLVSSIENATNSYKHVFLRALLNCIQRGKGPRVTFQDLFILMLEGALWPAMHYRLNLGASDLIAARLSDLVEKRGEGRSTVALSQVLADAPFNLEWERTRGLLRYVPQRLLTPWFAGELKGVGDHRRDGLIVQKSRDTFDAVHPLYRILDDGTELHPVWMDYFSSNLELVRGWSDAQWLRYLSTRNPHVPALVDKIDAPPTQRSMTRQRQLWAGLLAHRRLACIYTGVPISCAGFVLDHFLPRAFVAHDRIWNLTPVHTAVNAQKSDRLPANEFVERLADQHAVLTAFARDHTDFASQLHWKRGLDEYEVDLKLGQDDLLDAKNLRRAYAETFAPLTGIARRMGFQGDWKPEVLYSAKFP